MFKKVLIILAVIAYGTHASAMEARKRECPEVEQIISKKPHIQTMAHALMHVCHARKSFTETCKEQFETAGLLNRHLREKHGIAPKKKIVRDCPCAM